jgi:hypothetical protein
MVNGTLTLQTPDGRPVLKGEKPVPFEREALIGLLNAGDSPQAKTFQSITIASKASGAAGTQRSGRVPEFERPPQFGLR